MNLDLTGKRALVTGGSRGIGGSIATALAKAGASVAILSRDPESLQKQKEKLEEFGSKILVYSCDVLDSSQVKQTWNLVAKEWDGVDILINNVGGGGRWGTENILETPEVTWEEVIRKNLGVAIQLTSLSLPYMKLKKWGRVINITSIYGVGIGGRPWFNIAKVAQTTLTKNLARNHDFSRHGITFNSIAPGAVFSEGTGWAQMLQNQPTEFKNFLDTLPLGRMGNPDEIASLALFICSDEASYLNGASIVMDGGESAALF